MISTKSSGSERGGGVTRLLLAAAAAVRFGDEAGDAHVGGEEVAGAAAELFAAH